MSDDVLPEFKDQARTVPLNRRGDPPDTSSGANPPVVSVTGVPVSSGLPSVPEEHQELGLVPVAAVLPATFIGTTTNENTANATESVFASASQKEGKSNATSISSLSESIKSYRRIDPPAKKGKKNHHHPARKGKKTHHSQRTVSTRADSSRRLSSQGSVDTGLGKHLIWALVAAFVVVIVAATVVAVILVKPDGNDDDGPEPEVVKDGETTSPRATSAPTSEIVKEEESQSNKETKVYLFILIPAASCLLLPLCAACMRKKRGRSDDDE